MADLAILQRPFDNLKSRRGADGKSFTYVPGGDILDRIIEATQGIYDWEIIDLRYIEGPTIIKDNGETFTKPGTWMVHGRLTMPGLGSRDGIGTAVALNEDAPKSAETDSLKRAAVKFGIALQLYQKDEQTASGSRPARQAAAAPTVTGSSNGGKLGPINNTGSQCPYCKCPSGGKHLATCSTLAQAA